MPPVADAARDGTELAALRVDELLPLARAAAAGDAAGVRTLVMEVGASMLRTVRKVLGPSHPDVEDVTQDAVLALIDNLPEFRAECSVRHYANRVALLTALTASRRLRVRGRYDDREASVEGCVDEQSPSPLATAISSRRRQLVLELLRRLPEPTAEALALHFVLGHTVEEIATLAGVPQDTVWSRLRLGKRALRRALANDARLAELGGRNA
jgi:RNA polymerase sigma factor (sigma-70 family)